mmetsp:Transcript_7377/g.17591  ORF Transcript_7377/g.17591 Transcript_7377/m.17591 type:complete len:246 (-) Transcript_7377:188-925(-)
MADQPSLGVGAKPEQLGSGSALPKRIRLHYFRGRGRAEAIRFALGLAGAEWEDVFVETQADMQNLIGTGQLLFGQVPMLEVDGKRIVQTGAILRFIARTWNLYGDETKCDMVIEAANDLLNAFLPLPFQNAKGEDLTARLAELRRYWMPKYCGPLETLLAYDQWLGGGPTATVADAVMLRCIEEAVEYLSLVFLGPFPAISAWRLRMLAVPNMQTFLQSSHRMPAPVDADVALRYATSVRKAMSS